MNPGRELDALIAKHVMGDEGYTVVVSCPDRDPYCQTTHTVTSYRAYSTDIFYAWQVVERLKDKGWATSILNGIAKNHTLVTAFNGLGHKHVAQGLDAPHAICLAALKAMGFEK